MSLREWIKARYRLQLVSERKGESLFSFSMSVWLTILLGVVAAVALALLVVVVMTRTPLRHYLPGYLDVSKRAVVEESAMRIDSLVYESRLRSVYLDNLCAILSDRVVPHEVEAYDSSVVRLDDSLRMASEREAAFVERYSARERFGLNVLADDEAHGAAANPVFMSPVHGQAQEPDADDPSAPLCVMVEREFQVLAPQDGWVVLVQRQLGLGWTIVMQMSGDWLVCLSHLSMPLVEAGDFCRAGHAIAHVGEASHPEDRWLGIQLWHRGQEIDPREVMGF